MTIENQPLAVVSIGAPVGFRVLAASNTNRLRLTLEYRAGAEISAGAAYQPLADMENMVVGADSRLEVDVAPFLRAALRDIYVPSTGTLSWDMNGLAQWRWRWREYDETGNLVDDTGNNQFWGVRAFFSPFSAKDINAYALPGANQPFFTQRPQQQVVFPGAADSLGFMYNGASGGTVDWKVSAQLVGGSTVVATIGSLTFTAGTSPVFVMLRLPCDVGTVETAAGGEVSQYTVYVEKDGVRISEERHFLKAVKRYPYERHFSFLNPLGGYDTITTYGDATHRQEAASQTTARMIGAFPARTAREMVQEHMRYRETIEQPLGYRPANEWQWILELLRSPSVYRQDTEGLTPITLEMGEAQYQQDNNFLNPVSIRYKVARWSR